MITQRKPWHTVIRDVNSAEHHFLRASKLFDVLVLEKSHDVYTVEMAFQHAMQSGYTSIESAIRKIFHITGEEIPTGSSSHKELLLDSFEPYADRPAIFTDPLVQKSLHALRGFRHVAAHSYDDFSTDLAAPSARAAKNIAGKLASQILDFIEKFDPCSDVNEPINKAGLARPKN